MIGQIYRETSKPSDFTIFVKYLSAKFNNEELENSIKITGRGDGQEAQVVSICRVYDIKEYIKQLKTLIKLNGDKYKATHRTKARTHCKSKTQTGKLIDLDTVDSKITTIK